mgnify:CR=1 FL=1
MNSLEDFTPEELEALIGLGSMQDQQSSLNRQRDQADLLRNTPIPKGGMAGRVYVGDPFGALAAGVERYMGHKQGKALDSKEQDIWGKQTDARNTYMKALLGKLRSKAPPQNWVQPRTAPAPQNPLLVPGGQYGQ